MAPTILLGACYPHIIGGNLPLAQLNYRLGRQARRGPKSFSLLPQSTYMPQSAPITQAPVVSRPPIMPQPTVVSQPPSRQSAHRILGATYRTSSVWELPALRLVGGHPLLF